MRILVLGATGRVGSVILNHALRDEHEVSALVRQPDKVSLSNRMLTIIQGNAMNRADLSLAIRKVDVIISALGTDGTTTLSESMKIMIDEMNNQGINRIITVGTAGILQSRTEPELYRYQSSESRRRSAIAAEEHRRVYERLRGSNLNWTIVCPTYLPDGDATGSYRVERDYLPEDGVSISVGDTAAFTYQQIVSSEYIRTRVGIAY